MLTDGLLYGSIGSGSDNIKMGNADGQETVCMGGEILAYGGSRAVVLRANKKNDRLCLVKYPEDEVQHYIDGTPYLILAGENFVLAVICGEQSRYLFSLADGSVLALDAVPLALTEVELDDYLAASIKERVIPSKEALAAAEPAKLASVFACALAKSDRAAINRMLENSGVWISPYAPLYFKQWTASKLPSAYEIELVPYFENDLAFAGFLPAALRKISVNVGGIEMQLPFPKFLERNRRRKMRKGSFARLLFARWTTPTRPIPALRWARRFCARTGAYTPAATSKTFPSAPPTALSAQRCSKPFPKAGAPSKPSP